MSTFKLSEQSPQHFKVEGQLTFSSIDKKAVKSLILTTNSDSLKIDLKQVIKTDSAGLALLIEWLRLARQSSVQLIFQNVPPQLITLAKMASLEEVIHITEENGTTVIASQQPV